MKLRRGKSDTMHAGGGGGVEARARSGIRLGYESN